MQAMKLKPLIPAAALALGVLGMNPVLAHGSAKPQHGGIVQVANDVSFELVPEADGATIHLMDHGKPMASKGIAGKLTVLQGSNKTEVEIKDAGENRLRATGVKIGKGDKLVAVLSNVAGRNATVRFTVK
jgi:uncharacterized Zn-binding protein involved in type VI secretion